MATTVQLKKLKRAMYSALRWRLQLPNYVPHNPIPNFVDNPSLTQFSQGVICAYADLMRIIDEIEESDNQRRLYPKPNKYSFFPMYGNKEDDEEAFVDEMRWGKGQGQSD